jgi:GAF domain-containing protein
MADSGEEHVLVEVLAEWARTMTDFQTSEQVLERMGDYCTKLLPLHGVGVLLRTDDGGLEVATANSDTGRIVEQLEAELAEGPCTDALASGEQLMYPDLAAAEERYPRFVPRALEAGVRSVHAVPMSSRGETIGSLNLISLEVQELTSAQLSIAQMLADVTVSYLGNSRLLESQTKLAAQLQSALDSRVVIEQAKGKVSERSGISVTDAFEVMRRYARNNGLKLHAVAAAVIRGDLDL